MPLPSAERSCRESSGRAALAAQGAVTQRQEQCCTLGPVVLGHLIIPCLQSRSPQPPHRPGLSLLFSPSARGRSCTPELCRAPGAAPSIPVRLQAGPPSPGSLQPAGQREQRRECRPQQPPISPRPQAGKAQALPGSLLPAEPKMPGTVPSEHSSLSNRYNFFQRSSTAGIYRTEGNF